MKLLHERLAGSERQRRRFLDEAIVLQQLDHRNVIDVLEVQSDAARPFLVMELAEGGSLMDWSRTHGPMPARMAVDLAIQMCKGLDAAHRIGVIHRDVKPHNILLTRRGVAKVTDFGIAQLPRHDGSTDVPDAVDPTASGTIGYMAPEQRKDPRLVDPRTDIYGVGATLYTLLTAQTVTDLFIAERETDLLQAIPKPLRPLLLRAVNYQQDFRFRDMPAFAKALYEVRSELPEDPWNAPPLVDGETTASLQPPRRPPSTPPPTPVPPDLIRKPATTPPTDLRLFTSTSAQDAPTTDAPSPALTDPGRWKQLALFAATAAFVVAAALGGGTARVRTAATAYDTAVLALYETVERRAAVIEDLAVLGADKGALEDSFRAQASADDADRLAAIRSYVAILDDAVERHGDRAGAAAVSARTHLEAMNEAIGEVATERAVWTARSQGFPGSLAVAAGLAPAAP